MKPLSPILFVVRALSPKDVLLSACFTIDTDADDYKALVSPSFKRDLSKSVSGDPALSDRVSHVKFSRDDFISISAVYNDTKDSQKTPDA